MIRMPNLGEATNTINKETQEEILLKRSAEIVRNLTKSWNILDEAAEARIPRFEVSELKLGRVLGRGGFCVVNEVSEVVEKEDDSCKHMQDKSTQGDFTYLENKRKQAPRKDNGKVDEGFAVSVRQDKEFIAKKYLRNGHARYCIKRISDETYKNKQIFFKGVIDLVIETKVLAVLHHPNIIKMRGIADGNPYVKNNFILLDKLYDTMPSRLHTWRKEAGKLKNKLKQNAHKLFVKRLLVAYDLCSAFVYLHEHNIVYRDLKPDNIGFDVRDDVKMFDFGLAKELPKREDNALYNLSAQTGSLRYMAPEVALGKPYNLKVDVFSFSILLWEILNLQTPFSGFNVRMHKKVVVESGGRPRLNKKWSKNIQNLLFNSWCENINQRLNFHGIDDILRDELFSEEGIDTSMIDCSSRTARSL